MKISFRITVITIVCLLQAFVAVSQNQKTSNVNAAPTNLGFEAGNCSGWYMHLGTAAGDTETVGGKTYNIPSNIVATSCDSIQHTIVSAGNDPNIGSALPMVGPNSGNYSLHLGDYSYGYDAAIASQTFEVAPDNALLNVSFAVVLEDGVHNYNEQPYFRIRIKDANGNDNICSEYYIYAGSGGDPSLLLSGNYSYKPWSTWSISLDPYIGTQVTLECTVSDCNQGGHLGYAYIDASVGPMQLNTTSQTICAGNDVIINAPAGIGYQWTTPAGYTGPTNQQIITTNQGGIYQVHVQIDSADVCGLDLPINLANNPSPQIANVDSILDICSNGGPVTLSGIPTGGIWSGAGITDTSAGMFDPGMMADGDYPIVYTMNSGGCISSDTIHVLTSICIGINEEKINNKVTLISNMDNEIVFLQKNNTYTKYRVTDILGKVIAENIISGELIKINKPLFANSIYFIQFLNTNEINTIKMSLVR